MKSNKTISVAPVSAPQSATQGGVAVVGIDLGDSKHHYCALNATGNVVRRGVLANTKAELEAFFRKFPGIEIGMETGAHTRWIATLAAASGCRPVVGNARKLASIYENSHKSDRRDAEEIAHLVQDNKKYFSPVHLRDEEHQLLLQIAEGRDRCVRSRGDLIRHIRGIAKAMGAALPSNWSTATFAERLRERLPALPQTFREFPVESMVAAINALSEAIKDYERQMDRYTAEHFPEEVNRLQTIPGVGRIVSNVFVAVIGDPQRFRRPRDAGPYLGLTPGRDSSSEKDETKAISKEGNPFARWILIEAANRILADNSPDTDLKRLGERIIGDHPTKIRRRRAKVAIARELAVVMLAMLRTGTDYNGIHEAATA